MAERTPPTDPPRRRGLNEENVARDRALVARVLEAGRQGDPEPFARIVELYGERVHSVLLGMLGNREDAADATQEVFLKAHRNLHRWAARSALYTWLYRVAVNTAADMRKSRRARLHAQMVSLSGTREDQPDLAPAGTEAGPAGVLSREEATGAVHRALAEVPQPYREVLVLRELEGLTYGEIASILRLRKGTVESRLYRGREALRRAAERLHLEELL